MGFISIILSILSLLFDLTYFVKVWIQIYPYKWGWWLKTKELHDEIINYGICLPFDVDYLYHMNHAKYLRVFEFSRAIFVGETGLLHDMIESAKEKKYYVVTAIAIRYRRQVRCFERYKVSTKLVYIEGRDYFFEQKMIGLSDNFVKAVLFAKATFTAPVDAIQALKDAGVDVTPFMGPVDEDLLHFIEYNKKSSIKYNPRVNAEKVE